MKVGCFDVLVLSIVGITFPTVLARLESSHLSIEIGVGLGIALGLAIFILSFAVTILEPFREGLSMFKQAKTVMVSPLFFSQTGLHLITALYEELIWRVCLQGIAVIYLGFWSGIVSIAILFWAWHLSHFQGNKYRAGEFLTFSLLLGLTYETTMSYPLIVAIHAMRNIMIVLYRLSFIRQRAVA